MRRAASPTGVETLERETSGRRCRDRDIATVAVTPSAISQNNITRSTRRKSKPDSFTAGYLANPK
jgi:hypothetical protein